MPKKVNAKKDIININYTVFVCLFFSELRCIALYVQVKQFIKELNEIILTEQEMQFFM